MMELFMANIPTYYKVIKGFKDIWDKLFLPVCKNFPEKTITSGPSTYLHTLRTFIIINAAVFAC